MLEVIGSLFMIMGSIFMVVAGLGIIKFPDIYMRISAATKASTLGVGLSLCGLSLHFGELGITMRSLAVILFVTLTSPVAAHLISRAAYRSDVKLWEKSIIDELKGQYDPETGELASTPRAQDMEKADDFSTEPTGGKE